MTKEEIAAMIAAKIEGQGTNVDAGSALPAILNGILELIPSEEDVAKELTLETTLEYNELASNSLTKQEFATTLGVSEEVVDSIFMSTYKWIRLGDFIFSLYFGSPDEVGYGFSDYLGESVTNITLSRGGENYSIYISIQ